MKTNKASKKPILTALIFAILLPGVSIVLLGSLATIFTSDVSYPLMLAELCGYINELIGVGSVFITAGCIAAAELSRSSGRLVAAIAYVSPLLLYLISIAVDVAFWGDEALAAIYIVPIAVNCLFELARYLLVRRVARQAARRSELRSPVFFSLEGSGSRAAAYATLVIFVTLMVTNLTETISLLVAYGAPINTSELVTLVLPYPTAIVYSLLGYLAICITIKSLVKEKSHANP